MPYTKPENVLRRAEELVGVNQKHAALTAIGDVLLPRRSRSIAVGVLEPIMLRFIDLALELGRLSLLKEGFHAYKNNFQNTQPASVEKIVHYYIDKAKEKLDTTLQDLSMPEKSAAAAAATGEEADDLETPDTPESLSYAALVDGTEEEQQQQQSSPNEPGANARNARTTLGPALRQVCAAYRTSLDLVRNNNKLESLYHQLAADLFAFCIQHRRRTELRRACDTLRQHLQQAQRASGSNHIDLSKPEVSQPHIETRFLQLNATIELELWQEAFRTAEDINSLFAVSRKSLKSSTMVTYYEKLVSIFAVGENPLYRAAAYTKLLAFTPEKAPVATDDESPSSSAAAAAATSSSPATANLADHVLLSLLSVPVSADAQRKPEDIQQGSTNQKDRSRLAQMLNLSREPTRQSLLRDALARNVLKRASPDVKELYTFLEVDFHPLSITSKIEPIFARLAEKPSLQSYLDSLREVVLARLFQQLAQVYDVLDLERAVTFAEGKQGVFSRSKAPVDASPELIRRNARTRVERFIADACRRGQLDVSIDHAQGSLKFTRSAPNSAADDVFGDFTNSLAADFLAPSVAAAANAQAAAPDLLQPPPATLMRTQLSRLANSLSISLSVLDPEKESKKSKKAIRRAQALAHMAATMETEREELLRRGQIIEHRINNAREAAARKEGTEAHARQLLQNQRLEEERKRLKELQEQRAAASMEKERKQARKMDNERLLNELREKGNLTIDENLDLAEVDRNDLLQMSVDAIAKEKREMNSKLSTVGKRLDHVERAMRLEEIPLLEKDYQLQLKRDRERHDAEWKHKVAEMKRDYKRKVDLKERFTRMKDDYSSYVSRMASDRDKINEERKQAAQEKIEEEKQKYIEHLRERKRIEREEEERRAIERAAEEERMREQREREAREAEERAAREAEQREREEEEARQRAEEQSRRNAERDEYTRKMDDVARRQRERELEMEKREEEKRKSRQTEQASLGRQDGAQVWRRSERVESAAPPAPSDGIWRPTRRAVTETAKPPPPPPSGGDRPPSKFPGRNFTQGSSFDRNGSRSMSRSGSNQTDDDGFQTIRRKESPSQGGGGGGSGYVPPHKRNK